MKKRFTYIDLFSGIGGFKIALSKNGGHCLGFSDINKDAIEAYCKNFGISNSLNFKDIRKIEKLPSHDILTAGVPCQSWSIAGKNLGFDDDRGQLWNDTIFLLKQSKPKCFIFENVKGLADPRNANALRYIMDRIKDAGYYANYYVINSLDYGVPQNRVRIFIIGFRDNKLLKKLDVRSKAKRKTNLYKVLGIDEFNSLPKNNFEETDLFGEPINKRKFSLSNTDGFNDYFLFNDIRNGHTTIHSWDIIETTARQKKICLLILKNRRKKQFGPLDGNPLSLKQMKVIDNTILKKEIDQLIKLEILKKIDYKYEIIGDETSGLGESEIDILNQAKNGFLIIDELKIIRELKLKKISISDTIDSLKKKKIIKCKEERFDFKNTKISSGLNGVGRIFLPTSSVYSTLVASDTSDYIALESLNKNNHDDYKKQFLEKIYLKSKYRKITCREACRIQGFPEDFVLPESRTRWMKLLGNSVSIPVIESLIESIIQTGLFDSNN